MSLSKAKSSTKPTKYAEQYVTAAGKAQGPAFEEASAIGKSYQPRLEQGAGLLSRVIGGDYLREGGNPHLEARIASSNRDITDNVNSTMMPRFGSAYHTNALVRGISENENRIRFDDYARERAYQMGAVGDQAQLAGAATALPQVAAGRYADSIGGLFGQYNKNKTSTPWGPAVIRGASNAAAAAAGGGG